ncbi:MAG: DUF4290 domain-containing protein [Bacteroidota bacterium]
MEYDYNTNRKKLQLPEYGRNVQKMVDHLMALENRDERNLAAKTIINIMGSLNPHLRDVGDFKHKLWDHLAIMSDFKLDIDFPYEIPQPEKLRQKPAPVPYNQHNIRFKHYCYTTEKLLKAATKIEDPREKEMLVSLIANQMKKLYLIWNREVVTDEIIFNDIKEITKGEIDPSGDIKLADSKDLLQKNKKKRPIKKHR